jgi:hypothetical protein
MYINHMPSYILCLLSPSSFSPSSLRILKFEGRIRESVRFVFVFVCKLRHVEERKISKLYDLYCHENRKLSFESLKRFWLQTAADTGQGRQVE